MYQVQKPQVYHKNHLVGGDGLDYLSGIHFSHNDVSLYCWLFAKRTRRHVDKCWIHYGPAQKPTRVGIQILETLPRNLSWRDISKVHGFEEWRGVHPRSY